jgi:DNA repair exonuclease SbcCD ATPase subunit
MSEEAKESIVEEVEGVEIVELDSPAPAPEEVEKAEPVSTEEPESTETVKESVDEEEELEEYSSKVQKRINNLTRKLREEERAKDSALNYAQQIQEENKKLRGSKEVTEKNYLTEAESRLSSQRVQATKALTEAQANQDFEKVAKATDILAKIAVEENKIDTQKKELEYQNAQKEEQNFQNTLNNATNPPPNQIDPKTQAWADKNEWFGNDQIMTMGAFTIDKQLKQEGFDPRTDEYYTEVDKRMRVEFPHKFEDSSNVAEKPQQRVASAARADSSTSGKRQVKLTPSEVQMAKKLNVPLTEYAKFVKR